MTDILIKQIQFLRDKWSLDEDKKAYFDLEKRAKEAMFKAEVIKMDCIKPLIEELENSIKEMVTLLAWEDGKLTDIERKVLVAKRDTYIHFYSLFTEPEKVLKSITAQVQAELENKI
jgi:hypothetical protein